MRRVPVSVPESMAPSAAIGTNFVRTETGGDKGEDPILMLHGFDSSLLEFRRLMPKLGELGADAYAVDVLGWGFTDLAGVSLFGAGKLKLGIHPNQVRGTPYHTSTYKRVQGRNVIFLTPGAYLVVIKTKRS